MWEVTGQGPTLLVAQHRGQPAAEADFSPTLPANRLPSLDGKLETWVGVGRGQGQLLAAGEDGPDRRLCLGTVPMHYFVC